MRRCKSWGSEPRLGFTLVELLVVIGIIAVLIAILLPVLNAARRRAQQIKCAANLRSVGHAMVLYNNVTGYFPGAFMAPTQTQQVVVWQPRLRAFLNGNRDV